MGFLMKLVCEAGENGEIGKPSLGRVLCVLSALMIMSWGTWITITTGEIADLPAEWVAFPIALYGLNKLPSTFGGK